MATSSIIVRVYRLEVLRVLMGSLEIRSPNRGQVFFICLFDAIIELHAMDEKKLNVFSL